MTTMGSLWRGLARLCDAIKAKAREAEGHAKNDDLSSAHDDEPTDEVKRAEHLKEVRGRRINKLENMRKAAAMDQDENLEEYAERRVAELKRLQQEAELVRLGTRRSSRQSKR